MVNSDGSGTKNTRPEGFWQYPLSSYPKQFYKYPTRLTSKSTPSESLEEGGIFLAPKLHF